jgi:hypothetical protein
MSLGTARIKVLVAMVALLLNTIFVPAAWAQSGKGIVTGRVTDTSDSILQAAQVVLQPKGGSAVSDAQGQFFVNDLEPGTYTVTITYVGFTAFTKTVTVVAGQSVTVDAKLTPASQSEEVLVTADRAAGEAEEINRQRTADNVVQVLTSDVIRSLPNANMADALGRLPSVTLERDEGEGKYVQVRGTEPRLTNLTVTESTFLRRKIMRAKSNWTRFPPTSWSPWKSTRPCRQIWMQTASGAR